MSPNETIPVALSAAERNVLQHLLENFIHERVWEAVRGARGTVQLEEAAERVRRLAQLWELTGYDDATMPTADAAAHRADLIVWAMETESTTEELIGAIADADDSSRSPEDRDSAIANARQTIVTDYAHKSVCERIIVQIDALQAVA